MNYRFSKTPKEIIDAALKTVGLDGPMCPQDVWADVSAIEWFDLCSSLYLNPDCVRYGYSRREHKARIRTAWENGELALPRTLELVALLREIGADRRADLRWGHQGYGFRLGLRVRLQNFRDDLKWFPRELRNRIYFDCRLNNYFKNGVFFPSSRNVTNLHRGLTVT